jgi:NADH-quinone oxidoreductase subunit E
MSVRRLAEEAVQPATFAFNKENAAWAKKRIALYPEGRQQSAVIPLLMRAQEQDRWISRAAIETIAQMLDMPYIRVLEVATFYTQFQLQPVGTKAHIQVCGTTPCMLRGAEDLRSVCQNKIHAHAHHLNETGTLSWEEVECLGACVNAPMVAIGADTYEDLTPSRLEEIIDAFDAGAGDSIQPGPQNGRVFSAPISGFSTLTGDMSKTGGTKTAVRKLPTTKIEKPSVKPAKAVAAAPVIPGGVALFEAPAGDADDLKLISGVGPVLEGKLNALGITRYAQVAAFKKADIAKVDEVLNFRGRIERDDWIKQAKALAKGGEAEYVRVFGKKPR